jgi:hypothetical protein
MEEILDSRPYRIACIGLFAALLLAPMTGSYFDVGTDVKRVELRFPEPRPPLPVDLQTLGAYPAAMDAHLDDVFGFRTQLITGHSLIHLMLGVSGSPRFILGREGWYFHSTIDDVLPQARGVQTFTPAQLERWVRIMEERQRWLEAQGIEFLVVVAPNKHSIYPEYLPDWVNQVGPTRYDQLLHRLARGSSLNFIDLRGKLRAAKGDLPLYFKTDGHWTEVGAFVAYRSIVEWIQQRHPEVEDFEREDLKLWWETRGFGTIVLGLNLMDFVQEDVPHLEPQAESRVYATEQLGTGANFSTTQVLRMKTHNEGMPRVLFMRDSYSNYIAQVLSENMSETVLVHNRKRYFDRSAVERHRPDIVIYEIVERVLEAEPDDG